MRNDIVEYINEQIKQYESILGRIQCNHGIYINFEEYDTVSNKEIFEKHRRYVDYQYMIKGCEIIEVTKEIPMLSSEYDVTRDIQYYYSNVTGKRVEIECGNGFFIYPDQYHMPGLMIKHSERIKKAVAKIPLSLFKSIKMLVMDVDGTMTDGKINISESKELYKTFNVNDGYGLQVLLKKAGIIPVVITGRNSLIVKRRCEEIGIKEVCQGVSDKPKELDRILRKYDIDLKNIAYIGDDLNDIECMKKIKNKGGLVGCPIDATVEVKEIADFISEKEGGKGAVRDFIDWVIV